MLKIELIRFEAADVITSSLPIAEPTNPVVDAEPSEKLTPVVTEPVVPDSATPIIPPPAENPIFPG